MKRSPGDDLGVLRNRCLMFKIPGSTNKSGRVCLNREGRNLIFQFMGSNINLSVLPSNSEERAIRSMLETSGSTKRKSDFLKAPEDEK